MVVLEPFIGLGDGLSLGITQGVAVVFRRNHGFQQMNGGGEMAGGEAVEQAMGVLFGFDPVSGRCGLRGGAFSSCLHEPNPSQLPRRLVAPGFIRGAILFRFGEEAPFFVGAVEEAGDVAV